MTDKQYYLGLQAWFILTYAATNQRVISYRELGKAMGYDSDLETLHTATPLGTVQDFCEAKKLPRLTGIVGSVRVYLPGKHYKGSKTWSGLRSDRKRVFECEWHLHHKEFCDWINNKWQG